MLSNPDRVVVLPTMHAIIASQTAEVHHCDFPEVRCEGGCPGDAAARLGELLARTLDGAPSDWRRERFERAIEDVRAFAEEQAHMSHTVGCA